MKVKIEFFGLSRLITGKRDETVDLAEGATFRELVRYLGGVYPRLIGDVIQPEMRALQPPNVLHVMGGRFIKQDRLGERLQPDGHIVLMSFSAGG